MKKTKSLPVGVLYLKNRCIKQVQSCVLGTVMRADGAKLKRKSSILLAGIGQIVIEK